MCTLKSPPPQGLVGRLVVYFCVFGGRRNRKPMYMEEKKFWFVQMQMYPSSLLRSLDSSSRPLVWVKEKLKPMIQYNKQKINRCKFGLIL